MHNFITFFYYIICLYYNFLKIIKLKFKFQMYFVCGMYFVRAYVYARVYVVYT